MIGTHCPKCGERGLEKRGMEDHGEMVYVKYTCSEFGADVEKRYALSEWAVIKEDFSGEEHSPTLQGLAEKYGNQL